MGAESDKPLAPEKATLGSKGPVDADADRVGGEDCACGAGAEREGLPSRAGVLESGGVLRNLLGAVAGDWEGI